MADTTIMEKIQALLRMAEHPNSNPNEAAIALERAQDLLLKHNLTRSQVFTGTTGQTAAPDGIGKIEITESDNLDWKSMLIYSMAKNNLCQTVKDRESHKIHLFGSYTNVLSVLNMYHWVIPQLERMNVEAWAAYAGSERRQSWNKGFYMGAVNIINLRLQKPFEAFSYGTGRDLVIFNSKAVSTAVHKIFPHVIQRRHKTTSHDGYHSGQNAGRNVSFGNNTRLSGGALRLGAGR